VVKSQVGAGSKHLRREQELKNAVKVLVFLIGVLLLSCKSSNDTGAKPNILLVMTDDQGWGDIQSHGNEIIRTPNLDRLASDGVRFERFFVSPVCAPTRASLLTGRYFLRTGVHGVTRGWETMRAEEVTMAEILLESGYATGCFGKWHNGAHYPNHPNSQGFEEFFGFCAGHWNNYFDTELEHNGLPVKTNGYITDVLTDAAMQFIDQNKDGPFFCYVPFNAPHSPWQVPDQYLEPYWEKGLDDKAACAYAMVENIDFNMGRLLKKLEELHLSDKTIVLFLTDNGPNSDRFNGGMKGRKGSVHEGGVRVPLFIKWPGQIPQGKSIDKITAHIDILPTLLEMCGISLPQDSFPLDGKSLVPLIMENGFSWPDRKLFSYWANQRVTSDRGAVRTERWRAVKYENWELYDMTTDPSQQQDVAEENPMVVQQLSSSFEQWFEEVAEKGFDPIPTEIGHHYENGLILPAHEALLVSDPGNGIRYQGRAGWANDWITGWNSTESYAYWNVKVIREGSYSLAIQYACHDKNLGSEMELRIGDQFLKFGIDQAAEGQYLPSPDRIERGEVYERIWGILELGKLSLKPGLYELSLRALKIPGENAVELKGIRVRGEPD
jgi:arylsulfatase A